MIPKAFIPWLFSFPPVMPRLVVIVIGGTTPLAARLAADATLFVLAGGESVVYTPRGGTPRTILAIVDRFPSRRKNSVSHSGIEITVCNRATDVDDDTVGGVLASSLDRGGDTVTLGRRVNETAEVLTIYELLRHDEGILDLAVG